MKHTFEPEKFTTFSNEKIVKYLRFNELDIIPLFSHNFQHPRTLLRSQTMRLMMKNL